MKKKLWCVVYRTGGRDRFQWQRCCITDDVEKAKETRLSILRMGYHAFVEDYRKSLAVGLPETWGRDE